MRAAGQVRNEGDILLREELQALALQHPDRFVVTVACSRAPASFSDRGRETGANNLRFLGGYLTESIIHAELPDLTLSTSGTGTVTKAGASGSQDVEEEARPLPCRAFICGPGSFEKSMREIAEARGYTTKEILHQF